DPRFVPLDLAPVANARTDRDWPATQETPGDAPTLPPGPQRLNGVDWQLDRVVQLIGDGPSSHFGQAYPLTPEIALPDGHWSRVHVLLRLVVPITDTAPPTRAAQVLLIGHDGREHALDILTRRHLVPAGWFLERLLEPG